MPTFVARVRDSKGNSKKEKITAQSVTEARSTLRARGLVIQDLKQAQEFKLNGEINFAPLEAALTKVSVKDKAVFSRQFAALINAGVAIVRGLGVMAEQCSNPKLKKALVQISADVQQGMNLSEAMRKHPECFDNLYVSMVQAGEVGGVLDEVMNRLSKLLEDVARLQNQIKSALTYPVAVALFALAIFVAMTVFLIPIFADIFKQLGVELPALTQFMLWLSDTMRSWKMLIPIVGFVGGSFLFKQYYKTPMGRVTIDRVSLKMPLFGDLIEKTAVARFSRTFGALTRSGVPILTALEIVRDTAGNQVIANAVDASRKEIQQGGMISLALQKEQVFPVMAIQMISIGEETGELDQMLAKVADFYEDEVEQSVKALTSIIEPIMIIVLGGLVGIILISMYLPMFKIFEKLG
jgi:type IV pilus assembly protein PilC